MTSLNDWNENLNDTGTLNGPLMMQNPQVKETPVEDHETK